MMNVSPFIGGIINVKNLLSNKKRFFSLLIILLLVLSIPIVVFLSQQQQDIRQQAAANPNEIATIDGQSITQEMLVQETGDLYKTTTTDSEAIKTAFNDLVEQRLLDREAQQQSLAPTESELMQQLRRDGLSDYAQNTTIRETARIAVLKRKIEKKYTKTREAFTVGFWLPPADYNVALTPEQTILVTKQRQDTQAALTLIQTRLQQGDEPIIVARAVLAQFPSLNSVLAVNGYILDKTPEEIQLTEPLLYSYQGGRANLAFFKTLFEMQPNQVQTVIDKTSSDGGTVIKIITSTNGPFDTYTDWLRDAKAKRVVQKRAL